MTNLGAKGPKKKRKDVDYELLFEFFQKCFLVHKLWDVKDAFSTYVFKAVSTRTNEFGSMTARKDDTNSINLIFCHKRPQKKP